MDALKRIEKIIRENAFEQKKKKPRLKCNPGLALTLIGLGTTGLKASKVRRKQGREDLDGKTGAWGTSQPPTELGGVAGEGLGEC